LRAKVKQAEHVRARIEEIGIIPAVRVALRTTRATLPKRSTVPESPSLKSP